MIPSTQWAAQNAPSFASALRRISRIGLLLLLLLPFLPLGHATARAGTGPIYVASVEGTVTSVTTAYLERALQQAQAANATALIIELGDHGAVLRDARVFATEIASASVPVVVYVTPSGTNSGAAGALFLSAAHVSAMTPDTTFGSPYPLTEVDAALSQQTRDMVLDSVVEQLRGWNTDRGRDAAWVGRAVREGVVLSNAQASATQPPTVDLVASNRDELLTLLEGRRVKLQSGAEVQLTTLGQTVAPIAPTAWESLRLALADPTVAFVLLVLGILAVCLEFAAPGTTVFAGIGVVMLLASALGLFVLPVRWWALVLLVLAAGLIIAEFAVQAHGALAVVGTVLLGIGSLNMVDPVQAPGAVVAVWVILLVGLVLIVLVALGVWLAIRSRSQPVTTGQEGMVGRLAEVRERLDPDGLVFVEGALWRAISEDGAIDAGDWVRVKSVHDLRLIVQKLDREAQSEGLGVKG